jgi:23S rRNA (uracil-5-)-methyltransferase RumA
LDEERKARRRNEMKKGQSGEGKVCEVLFPNKGVVRTADGDRVIVKNTIPGQEVSFTVNKARKGKYEARLNGVLKRSEKETDSPCPHFEICGGCTYQTLPYEEQLALKENQVHGLLAGAITDWNENLFLGIKQSPRQFAYRNKMEFSFGDEYKDGPLALGMHKRGSFYDLVTVDHCQIVDEDIRRILMATLSYFSEQNIPYFHRIMHVGYLRHLLVRKAVKTGEILVDLVTTTQVERLMACDAAKDSRENQLLDGWKECLLGLDLEGTFAGILHTSNDSVADVIKNEGTEILYGKDFFYEELLGLRFRISPFSFFQTNSLGAEVLYSTARDFILDGDEHALGGKVVYDLYSGTGTIAQIMAPVCKEVVGVEIVEEAVEAAKENAKLNGLSNCRFLAGDVLKVLDEISEQPDYIILDPPRDGIHPKALERIIAYGVPRMVYISCKPTSLARDLEVLQARGYNVEKIACIDLFPGTYHVETVCLLSKLHADQYIEVELDMDELDLTDAEKKATYPAIKEYVQDQTGLKVSSLYIAQVKQKCGIIERENFNKPKSENSRQPQVTPEKEAAIMDALRHFGMIE